jgi:hypothetical protein
MDREETISMMEAENNGIGRRYIKRDASQVAVVVI